MELMIKVLNGVVEDFVREIIRNVANLLNQKIQAWLIIDCKELLEKTWYLMNREQFNTFDQLVKLIVLLAIIK